MCIVPLKHVRHSAGAGDRLWLKHKVGHFLPKQLQFFAGQRSRNTCLPPLWLFASQTEMGQSVLSVQHPGLQLRPHTSAHTRARTHVCAPCPGTPVLAKPGWASPGGTTEVSILTPCGSPQVPWLCLAETTRGPLSPEPGTEKARVSEPQPGRHPGRELPRKSHEMLSVSLSEGFKCEHCNNLLEALKGNHPTASKPRNRLSKRV